MTKDKSSKFLEKLAHEGAKWTATSLAFLIVCSITLIWLVLGPFLNFSTTWQISMSTLCSVITFMMVFLLQRSQHKNGVAMQIKLDEIIASLHGANNRLINIEYLEEKEIMELQKRYQNLASRIQNSTQSSTHAISTKDVPS